MICFLTSRIDNPDTGELYSANHFLEELRLRVPRPCRALNICSDPQSWETTDYYACVTKELFEAAGFSFERFCTLDSRNETLAPKLVKESDLLILSGGHVPTQNRFFEKIGLRDLLKDNCGVVVGISAGSMNSADVVYAQPEEEGEAIDPSYQRFLPGLKLTRTCLLPHYQVVKNDVLDGLRVIEDVTLPDSMGRRFYAIPDGSYLLIDSGKEILRGEAYLIQDGEIRQISSLGEEVCL